MLSAHTTVAVLYGGANSEHEVSLRSARDAIGALRGLGYVVRPVGIDRAGVWHAAEVDALAAASAPSAVPTVVTSAAHAPAPSRPARHPRGVRPELWRGVDVVFPLLHGRYGEDGTVQGAIELAGLPYVGSGVLASAIAMDKAMTWRVVSAAGVPMADTRIVDQLRSLPDAVRGMPLPLFVKPNRAGSSVGASIVPGLDTLATAVRTALSHDTLALVQPAIRADEVSIGVYRTPGGATVATGPSLVRVPDGDGFFDYDGKYSGRGPVIEVPGRVDAALIPQLRSMAIAAFEAIGAEGLARVDFFVQPDGTLLLNEVNTMPGLTSRSHFPRLCAEAGVSYPELLGLLMDRALTLGPR